MHQNWNRELLTGSIACSWALVRLSPFNNIYSIRCLLVYLFTEKLTFADLHLQVWRMSPLDPVVDVDDSVIPSWGAQVGTINETHGAFMWLHDFKKKKERTNISSLVMTHLVGRQKWFAVVWLWLSAHAGFELSLIKSAASDRCFLLRTRYRDMSREPDSQTSMTDGGSRDDATVRWCFLHFF